MPSGAIYQIPPRTTTAANYQRPHLLLPNVNKGGRASKATCEVSLWKLAPPSLDSDFFGKKIRLLWFNRFFTLATSGCSSNTRGTRFQTKEDIMAAATAEINFQQWWQRWEESVESQGTTLRV